MPIIMKYFMKSCDKFLCPKNVTKYPIIKDPIILTIRVFIKSKFGNKKLLELK